MIRQFTVVLICILIFGCAKKINMLNDASKKYQATKDYTSLQIVYKNLSLGMSRKDIKKLLGEPDYSPTEGLLFYSSSERRYSQDQNRDVVMGLIVDYRNKEGEVLDVVSKYYLGSIGE